MAENKVEALIRWINQNAFWRQELQVKESKYGGLGVFVPDLSVLDDDPLLLRIPKSNLLNAKTSSIYNLLFDYEWENVDISQGMFALIITVIYEVSFSIDSPWYGYLQSIDFESSFIPICLWSDDDKANLRNTQVDLLNLLDATELLEFYHECKRFAQTNCATVPMPQVLQDEDSSSLLKFSKYITSVTSRSFTIDNYFELSLAPAADLFNHLSPIMKNGTVVPQENIHFVCDGAVCDICGEQECDHEDDDGDDVDEEAEHEHEHELQNEDDDEEQEDKKIADNQMEQNEDNSTTSNDDMNEVEDIDVSDIDEITMDYIHKMEQDADEDSEIDTIVESEEESTVEILHANDEEMEPIDDELAKELSDSSKCCDVVLMRPPTEENNFEIFNSYGNELSNVELLQRYGFTCPGNPNDSCLLSVQAYKYIKYAKAKLSGEKAKQLEERLNWFEQTGFDFINEIIVQSLHLQHHDHNHDHDHDHDHSDDDCCSDVSVPETWQLAVKINYDGTVSPQTYALINIINLPHKLFNHKLLALKKTKLQKIIKELLIDPEDKQMVKKWCQDRLSRYTELIPSEHQDLIEQIIDQEKHILKQFIESQSDALV